jgi:hypothetical protein
MRSMFVPAATLSAADRTARVDAAVTVFLTAYGQELE